MTAATVVLCRCGHPSRLHDDDFGCERDGCGCTELRPLPSGEMPDAAPVSALVHSVLDCGFPGCDATFERPQARGGHRRYVHGIGAKPKPAAPVKTAPAPARPAQPPVPVVAAPVALPATAVPEPAAPVEMAEGTSVTYGMTVHVVLPSNAGTVDYELVGATRSVFLDFLAIVEEFTKSLPRKEIRP